MKILHTALLSWAAFGVLTLATTAATPASAQTNLITNGDFSAGNTGFTSQYSSAGAGTGVAAYSVLSNPSQIGWSNYGDHTTGTGLMLLLNGATNASLNFWMESIAVQPNTTYTFSGWAATTNGAPLATVNFKVNGTSLGTLTASSTIGQWTQFSGTWNSGALTTANLSLSDDQTASGNNDFSVDDLSFTAPAVEAPEPGALALVVWVFPLAGGIALRRRRTA